MPPQIASDIEVDDFADPDWNDDRAVRRHYRTLNKLPRAVNNDFSRLDWSSDRAVRHHMRSKNYSFDPVTNSWTSPIYPAEPPAGETFDTVLARYEQKRGQFLASTCWQSLKSVLPRRLSRANAPKNAVCIALGSLSAVGQCTGTLDDRTRSLFQLVGFVAVVELMERRFCQKRRYHSDSAAMKTCVKIPMLAQEPRFSNLDKQLLRHLKIRVLENPGIWNKITRRSMVYLPGAKADHFLVVANRRPAMWWPLRLSYLSYVKEIYPKAPMDEYVRTHKYLKFPDMRYVITPGDAHEGYVFGENSGIYLRKG